MKTAVPVLYLITALNFALTALLLLKYPSKYPNTRAGYRVKAAVKDKESWENGNRLAGRLCLTCACVLVALLISEVLFGMPAIMMLALYFVAAVVCIAAVIFVPVMILKKR